MPKKEYYLNNKKLKDILDFGAQKARKITLPQPYGNKNTVGLIYNLKGFFILPIVEEVR